MENRTLLGWVKRQRRQGCALAVLLSALSLATGLAALSLTFWVLWCASLLLAPIAMLHLSVVWPLAVTGLVAGVLFIDSLYSRRDDLSSVTLWLLRETIGLGPRLLVESLRGATRAVRLANLDARACADVLAQLAARRRSMSRDELLRACPDLVWPRLRRELTLLPGVLFLRADFSRVTLTEPLRLRLRQILGPQPRPQPPPRPEPQPQPEPEPPPRVEPERLSPHEILGVSPSASLAEIKAAYRSRIKECHPDRFAELDPASRALAEEWTKSLNAAYATLTAQAANTRVRG